MGCTASKLDNEDTVRRCKERRHLMADAVRARHHLAAAHSDYCRSLRLAGSALSSFANGEPLSVDHHATPAVFINTTTAASLKSTSFNARGTTSFDAPGVRLPHSQSFSSDRYPQGTSFDARGTSFDARGGASHQNAKPGVKLPHILSEPSQSFSSEKYPRGTSVNAQGTTRNAQRFPPLENYSNPFHKNPQGTTANARCTSGNAQGATVRRSKPPMKLPHILSESSLNSSPPHYTYNANASYSETPSQASSVWNWDNFYPPPSPPDSEFFRNRETKKVYEDDLDDKESVYSKYREGSKAGSVHSKASSVYSGYEYNDDKSSVYSSYSNKRGEQNHHLETEDEDERDGEEREEVHCSEWGDHYSTTSSSDDERDSRSEMDFKSESVAPPMMREAVKENVKVKVNKSEDGGSSSSWNAGEMKMVVRHKDLAEIVAAIKEYFEKEAAAGEQVSEMLETGRAQLDRSFKQLKKTVYHSSGMLSNLSSTWTSKPPLAVKYRFEPGSIEQTGGPKSLGSTLERLLAWEKKLYQEVKAREGVKIELEKKLATLQNQEYKGEDETKLDKTKASINKLQSLIVVTSQAVSTTSSAIVEARDTQLIPQLVELCHGFMYMWRYMNQFHEVQNHIVQQVRGLVNRSAKGESTSDLHRQATLDLESAVSTWHSSFCRLIKFQRDFIRSLHGWFKLTLFPVNSDPTNANREPSEVYFFLDEWKLALDRLPDTVASEAIKSFINVVHSIAMKQTEELKVKKRTETAAKDLEKKASSLRNIERKYYHSYSMVGLGLPDTGPDNGHMLDARDPLSEKKSELMACQRRVEEEMQRHSKAVEVTRAMTLNNLQTGLPGVFQAMTSFSALFMEALEVVCTRSYAIK